MTSPLHNRLEQVLADFEKRKTAIAGFEQDLRDESTTVTAKNRAVMAVVDGQGQLSEVKFLTNAYRSMAPAELAALVVETVKSAQHQAREKVAAKFQSLLPEGTPSLDIMSGPVDFDAAMKRILSTFDEVKRPFPGAGQ
ncbi:YbaB/EbfC family nucleoid-associated protein [Actinoplanes sp. NPDC049596]|uniref:YbaB/EbfC family nucleoid-associated protein n=1 Tax=unclassified Actinoplanes TaxID=2626549 RepID=UPI00343DE50F